MKLSVLILSSLLLGGCGDLCVNTDFRTSQGICTMVNNFDIDKDSLSYAIDVTEEFVFGKTRDDIIDDGFYKNLRISFVQEVPDTPTKLVGGDLTYDTFLGEYKIRVEHRSECSSYIAIVPHEMLHFYLLLLDGNDVHECGWFITTKCSFEDLNSLENKIFEKLKCDLCGVCT